MRALIENTERAEELVLKGKLDSSSDAAWINNLERLLYTCNFCVCTVLGDMAGLGEILNNTQQHKLVMAPGEMEEAKTSVYSCFHMYSS